MAKETLVLFRIGKLGSYMNTGTSKFGCRPGKSQGFTLIELLVVICIIGLLSAILFPAFQRIRENARRTTCASNMKQLGLGIAQYNQDNDGKFPSGSYVFYTMKGRGWAGQIFDYVKSPQIFGCPTDNTGALNYKVSYSYNAYIPTGATSETRLNRPGKTILLNEIYYNYPNLKPSVVHTPKMSDWEDEQGSISSTGAGTDGIVADNGGPFFATGRTGNDTTAINLAPGYFLRSLNGRHLGGANYLFADGHVKWLLPVKVSSGAWWNPNSSTVNCGNATMPASTGCTTYEATYNLF